MDNYKLRIKVGNNEFEAEGDKDSVTAQFEIFKELISHKPLQADIHNDKQNNPTIEKSLPNFETTVEQLNIIFNNDAKQHLVSLKIMPEKGQRHIADAILLILIGYKLIREEDHILGTQIKSSLRQSGIITERLDRQIENDIKEGLIIKSGLKKGSNYRLTNKGISEAQKLIDDILRQIIPN